MNVRESRIYRVTTEWYASDGVSFRRTHYHAAVGVKSAKAKEAAHNRTRAAKLAEDGFRWRIVEVTFHGTL